MIVTSSKIYSFHLVPFSRGWWIFLLLTVSSGRWIAPSSAPFRPSSDGKAELTSPLGIPLPVLQFKLLLMTQQLEYESKTQPKTAITIKAAAFPSLPSCLSAIKMWKRLISKSGSLEKESRSLSRKKKNPKHMFKIIVLLQVIFHCLILEAFIPWKVAL